jgi:hypothetical protein
MVAKCIGENKKMKTKHIYSLLIIGLLLLPFSLLVKSDNPTNTVLEKGLTYNIYKNGNKMTYEGYVSPVNYYDGKQWNTINREITNNKIDTGLYKVSFNTDIKSKNAINVSYKD